MKTKVSWCVPDCKRHSLHGDHSEILKCAKGHKPRFYKPKHSNMYWADDFGWKRICPDYKEVRNYVK